MVNKQSVSLQLMHECFLDQVAADRDYTAEIANCAIGLTVGVNLRSTDAETCSSLGDIRSIAGHATPSDRHLHARANNVVEKTEDVAIVGPVNNYAVNCLRRSDSVFVAKVYLVDDHTRLYYSVASVAVVCL